MRADQRRPPRLVFARRAVEVPALEALDFRFLAMACSTVSFWNNRGPAASFPGRFGALTTAPKAARYCGSRTEGRHDRKITGVKSLGLGCGRAFDRLGSPCPRAGS